MRRSASRLQTVISASRRTDIPAFYMKWFMEQIALGRFEVLNPYTNKMHIVPVSPETVHTIVFWSKNFGPFLENEYGHQLKALNYNLFFNVTVNSQDTLLEPNLPPLNVRLNQLTQLADQFGPETINWRFDPICLYKLNTVRHDTLTDVLTIAKTAAKAGITRCITSFTDIYGKVKRREARIPGFSFIAPDSHTKREIVLDLESTLSALGIRLSLCCEKELLDTLPPSSAITAASCIPNDAFARLFGGTLSMAKDTGQRKSKGCGCKRSSDIGSYKLHPCSHNCLYCYANPTNDKGPSCRNPE